MYVFRSIPPAPAVDLLTLDYSGSAELGTATITAVTWSCSVSPISTGTDPDPTSRLIDPPTFDNTSTTQKFGNGINEVTYRFRVVINLSGGRVIVEEAEISCLEETLPVLEPEPSTVGVVPFNYDAFLMQFPEFEGVSPEAIKALWIRATLFLRNDGTSPVTDLGTRSVLLNLLTAHLATMFAGPGGANGMVGRINSKSVDGVSVSSEGFGGVSGTAGWYLTTRYGADYWKATASFRTMQYVPGPQRFPRAGWPGTFGRWPYF